MNEILGSLLKTFSAVNSQDTTNSNPQSASSQLHQPDLNRVSETEARLVNSKGEALSIIATLGSFSWKGGVKLIDHDYCNDERILKDVMGCIEFIQTLSGHKSACKLVLSRQLEVF